MQIISRLNDDTGFWYFTPAIYITWGHIHNTSFGLGIKWCSMYIEIHFPVGVV